MKKKVYQQPTMTVVKLQQKTALLSDSVHSLSTNLTGDDAINYNGQGSNGDARVKQGGEYNVWDDDWSN
jgi:hypothetical protein